MHTRIFVGKESVIRAMMLAIDSFDFIGENSTVLYQSYFHGFFRAKGVIMVASNNYESIMTIQGFYNRLTRKV